MLIELFFFLRYLNKAINETAPIVDVIIEPSQPPSVDKFRMSKSQFPTNPPIIPSRIFANTPPDLDFIIFPASQPAIAPINTETNIFIILSLDNLSHERTIYKIWIQNNGLKIDYFWCMRISVLVFFVFMGLFSSAQNVVPMLDFNNFFKSFKDGYFQTIELQRIEGFKAGDNLVGYVDIRGNLIVYNGKSKMNLANLKVDYQVSDNLLTWKIGTTLNMWDDGVKKTLSFNVGQYWVKDEIIVFEDTRFNSVSVYFEGEVISLYTSVGDLRSPDFVGENIVAFRDNGDFNKVFWEGDIYDIDVWHNPFIYNGGTDILAFNDPISGTFAVFDKGGFIDVEDFHVGKYQAGREFVVYENRNDELIFYSNGKTEQLTNFGANSWEVKDDVVVWTENGFFYGFVDGVKTEIAKFIPEDYLIKNDVIVFRNMMGGVSALVNGKIEKLTSQMNSDFEIYGSTVLVKLFNNSYIVYSKGRKYTL